MTVENTIKRYRDFLDISKNILLPRADGKVYVHAKHLSELNLENAKNIKDHVAHSLKRKGMTSKWYGHEFLKELGLAPKEEVKKEDGKKPKR